MVVIMRVVMVMLALGTFHTASPLVDIYAGNGSRRVQEASDSNIEIVTFVCGTHYLTQIGPFIASIISNNNISLPHLRLTVFTDETGLKYLSSCIPQMRVAGLNIDVLDIHQSYAAPQQLQSLTQANSRWKCALNKLVLADMLPSLSRVLFLDVDTVIQEDLSALWRYFNSDEGKLYYGTWAFQHSKADWHPNGINTGVLLVDLANLRRRNITLDTYVTAMGNLPAPLGDQSYLNNWFSAHLPEIGIFPCKWNKRNENKCPDLMNETLRHLSGIAHGPNNGFHKMWSIPYPYVGKFYSICGFQ
jgi:lipopolysaccharide biosynthesis glycosyltransferase